MNLIFKLWMFILDLTGLSEIDKKIEIVLLESADTNRRMEREGGSFYENQIRSTIHIGCLLFQSIYTLASVQPQLETCISAVLIFGIQRTRKFMHYFH